MVLGSSPFPAGSHVPANVLWVLGAAAGILVIGTVWRLVLLLRGTNETRLERLRSLATWWVLLLSLAVTVLGGPHVTVILLAILSLLGMREYTRLTREMAAAPWIWPASFFLIVAHYAVLYLGFVTAARFGTPLVALLIFVLIGVLAGTTKGFVRVTAVPLWGVLLIVYCPSHAAMLAIEPPWTDAAVTGTAGFLYVVLLTEFHDIAQAMWGRTLGKRKITPTISPNKTWEGFLLGSATTVCLAVVMAPLVLPLAPAAGGRTANIILAAASGLVIALFGFVGDVCLSAVKRDVGVKDSGRLLPGQGGILDRIDSLTLAAPAFYHYMLALGRYAGV